MAGAQSLQQKAASKATDPEIQKRDSSLQPQPQNLVVDLPVTNRQGPESYRQQQTSKSRLDRE